MMKLVVANRDHLSCADFQAQRHTLPMDVCVAKPHTMPSADVEVDISRIISIRENCRKRFATWRDFLFNAFSTTDVMYAPVVWRFRRYGIALPAAARAWYETIRALPAMRSYHANALTETSAG